MLAEIGVDTTGMSAFSASGTIPGANVIGVVGFGVVEVEKSALSPLVATPIREYSAWV